MSDNSQSAKGLLEQVQASRKKKKIEALKGKLGSMLDDREKAVKALADIDQAIIDQMVEAGLDDADSVAEVFG